VTVTAPIQPTHEAHGADARRFDGLVSASANFELVQNTRRKVELPIKAYLRGCGIIDKNAKPSPDQLLALCLTHGAPQWMPQTLLDLQEGEQHAKRLLLDAFRPHPMAAFPGTIRGLGDHSFAALLGHLSGDPYIAFPLRRVGKRGASVIVEDDPYVRSFSQLCSYCGVGDWHRKRRAGMSQEQALACGRPRAKARLWNIAASLLKAGNREGYDRWRGEYEDRVHEAACAACAAKKGGPPAPAGSPWRDGHKHAAALRMVAKYEVLAPVYDEAKRLHEEHQW